MRKRRRRREALIRAQTDPSEPEAELPAAGVGGSWSRCLSPGFCLSASRYDTRSSPVHPRRELRRKAAEFRWFHFTSLFFFLLFFFNRSAPRSDAGGAAPRPGLIRLIRPTPPRILFPACTLRFQQKNGPVLDCLSVKGIMIFSDMSTGTNSPKVHPPNGTRFYTFQASELRGSSSSSSPSPLWTCSLPLLL